METTTELEQYIEKLRIEICRLQKRTMVILPCMENDIKADALEMKKRIEKIKQKRINEQEMVNDIMKYINNQNELLVHLDNLNIYKIMQNTTIATKLKVQETEKLAQTNQFNTELWINNDDNNNNNFNVELDETGKKYEQLQQLQLDFTNSNEQLINDQRTFDKERQTVILTLATGITERKSLIKQFQNIELDLQLQKKKYIELKSNRDKLITKRDNLQIELFKKKEKKPMKLIFSTLKFDLPPPPMTSTIHNKYNKTQLNTNNSSQTQPIKSSLFPKFSYPLLSMEPRRTTTTTLNDNNPNPSQNQNVKFDLSLNKEKLFDPRDKLMMSESEDEQLLTPRRGHQTIAHELKTKDNFRVNSNRSRNNQEFLQYENSNTGDMKGEQQNLNEDDMIVVDDDDDGGNENDKDDDDDDETNKRNNNRNIFNFTSNNSNDDIEMNII